MQTSHFARKIREFDRLTNQYGRKPDIRHTKEISLALAAGHNCRPARRAIGLRSGLVPPLLSCTSHRKRAHMKCAIPRFKSGIRNNSKVTLQIYQQSNALEEPPFSSQVEMADGVPFAPTSLHILPRLERRWLASTRKTTW